MARLAGLVVGGHRMCPTNHLLLAATVSCSAACPDRAITSSFVMWSRHENAQNVPNRDNRSLICDVLKCTILVSPKMPSRIWTRNRLTVRQLFLADRTNGRAIVTLLRLSSVVVVCRRL